MIDPNALQAELAMLRYAQRSGAKKVRHHRKKGPGRMPTTRSGGVSAVKYRLTADEHRVFDTYAKHDQAWRLEQER